MMQKADIALDVKGLLCPIPILRAKKQLKTMSEGQLLSVVATDPASLADFKAFCEQTGSTLEQAIEDQGQFYFLIRK